MWQSLLFSFSKNCARAYLQPEFRFCISSQNLRSQPEFRFCVFSQFRLLFVAFLKVWSLENPTLLGFLGFSRENPTFQSILGFSRENRNLLGFRGFLVVVNPVLDRWKAWLKRDILEYPCFSAQWRHVVPQVWKNFSLWIFLKAFSGKPYFLGFFRVFQR